MQPWKKRKKKVKCCHYFILFYFIISIIIFILSLFLSKATHGMYDICFFLFIICFTSVLNIRLSICLSIYFYLIIPPSLLSYLPSSPYPYLPPSSSFSSTPFPLSPLSPSPPIPIPISPPPPIRRSFPLSHLFPFIFLWNLLSSCPILSTNRRYYGCA